MYRVPAVVCLTAMFAAGAAFAQTAKPAASAPASMPMHQGAAMPQGAMPQGAMPQGAMHQGGMHQGGMHQGGARSGMGLVASAMSAAPAAVARHATVIDVGPKGDIRVVRKGSSGFTCMADNPATPGPDPMCMDENALEWAKAWMSKAPPPQKVGFMYMLAGGTDASNTDPYAKRPSRANHWVKTGPHVMIVGDQEILQHYPSAPDPDTSQPYVMWGGTPYAHLMIPIR